MKRICVKHFLKKKLSKVSTDLVTYNSSEDGRSTPNTWPNSSSFQTFCGYGARIHRRSATGNFLFLKRFKQREVLQN